MTEDCPDATQMSKIRSNVAENLRAEYHESNSYGMQVVTFRFTVLSFFLATVGLVLSADHVEHTGLVLIGLATTAWLLDLRNRVLLGVLGRRGKEIEGFWNNEDAQYFQPYTYHNHGRDCRPNPISIYGITVAVSQGRSLAEKLTHHALAIDFLIALTIGYGLHLICGWALGAGCIAFVLGLVLLWVRRARSAPQSEIRYCPICTSDLKKQESAGFQNASSTLYRCTSRNCGSILDINKQKTEE
jgi:hypothetical protein